MPVSVNTVGSGTTWEQGANSDLVERLRIWCLKAIRFSLHAMAAKTSTFCTFYGLYGEGKCNARAHRSIWFRIYMGTGCKQRLSGETARTRSKDGPELPYTRWRPRHQHSVCFMSFIERASVMRGGIEAFGSESIREHPLNRPFRPCPLFPFFLRTLNPEGDSDPFKESGI